MAANTSCAEGNRTAINTYDDPFELCVRLLNQFGVPVIVLCGVFGNLVSLSVFSFTHAKWQACSVYLAFLNIVDSLFLLTLLMPWLAWVGVYLFHTHGWCQATIYISYVTSFLSTWTVVAFTVERYIAVYHPLVRPVLCTRSRTVACLAGLTACAALIYLLSLLAHDAVEVRQFGVLCVTIDEYDGAMRVLTATDTVITLVLPSVTIVSLNIMIATRVWKVASAKTCDPEVVELKSVTSTGRTASTRSYLGRKSFRVLRKHSPFRGRSLQWRTTRSLLVVSSVFVILNLPAHCLRIHLVFKYLVRTDNSQTTYMHKWSQLLQFLSYTNYSANFFLYCACSQTFRSGLKSLGMKMVGAVNHRRRHSFIR